MTHSISPASVVPHRDPSEDLTALALVYEREGLRWIGTIDASHEAESRFDLAFDVLTKLAETSHWRLEKSASFTAEAEDFFRCGLPDDVVRNELLLAFRLAVAGLLGQRVDAMRIALEKADSIRPFHFGDFVLQAFLELVRADPSARRLAELQRAFLDLRGKPWIDGCGGNAIIAGFDHLMEMVSGAFQQFADPRMPADRFVLYLRDQHRNARAAFEGAPAREMLAHIAQLMYAATLHIGLHLR